jgi:hypothetical protein
MFSSMNSDMLELYDARLVDEAGRDYAARVCGRERGDGTWEGWLEFERDDGIVLRTERETTQPNQTDLLCWASGLTPVYLEGAFERAVEPGVPAHHAPLRSLTFTTRR